MKEIIVTDTLYDPGVLPTAYPAQEINSGQKETAVIFRSRQYFKNLIPDQNSTGSFHGVSLTTK